MKIKNWTDKITDEFDPWFNALKMEDGADFVEASVLYLEDATRSLQKKLFLRAALSCLGAAECLVRVGHTTDARKLFLETAMIYEENGEQILGTSIRESLWSLQQAYENFILASDYYRAQQVFDKYIFVAKKLNPFYGEKETMELLNAKKKEMEDIQQSWIASSNIKDENKLYEAIEKLTNLRQSSQSHSKSIGQIHELIKQNKEVPSHEKNTPS